MNPVECYSGSRYAERPLALWWQGQRLNVAALLDSWRSPTGPCFRVRTAGPQGNIFELTYDELQDKWGIHPI